jgi:hypothetical protein
MDDRPRASGAGQNPAYRPARWQYPRLASHRAPRATRHAPVGMQIVHVLTPGNGRLVGPMQLVPGRGASMQVVHRIDAVGVPEGHSMQTLHGHAIGCAPG